MKLSQIHVCYVMRNSAVNKERSVRGRGTSLGVQDIRSRPLGSLAG